MANNKNVQIPQDLFLDLSLFMNDTLCELEKYENDGEFNFAYMDIDEVRRMSNKLMDKLNRVVARGYYTKSQTADTLEERQEAKQKYFEATGMPTNYWKF